MDERILDPRLNFLLLCLVFFFKLDFPYTIHFLKYLDFLLVSALLSALSVSLCCFQQATTTKKRLFLIWTVGFSILSSVTTDDPVGLVCFSFCLVLSGFLKEKSGVQLSELWNSYRVWYSILKVCPGDKTQQNTNNKNAKQRLRQSLWYSRTTIISYFPLL